MALAFMLFNGLKAEYPDFPQVEFLDGGTLSFSLIGGIEDATN